MLDKDAMAEIDRMIEFKEPLKKQQEEIAELIAPYLMDMDGTRSNQVLYSPGHYSGVAKENLEVFSRGMFSHMVGGDVDFLEAGIFGNQDIMRDPASQEFFDGYRIDLLDELYRNSWFDTVKPTLEYAGALGTDFVSITGDYYENRIDPIHWHPGDVLVGEDGSRRKNRVAVKIRLSAKDISEMDDLDVPESIMREAQHPATAKKEKILWGYYKRMSTDDPEAKDVKMQWKYLLLGKGGHVYHKSYAYSQPGTIWPFEDMPRSPYGMGMGQKLYRDILQSNKIQKLLMQETEVRVNPPVYIPNRTNKAVYMDPGSINYLDNPDGSQIPRRMIDVADMLPAQQLKAEIDILSRTHMLTDFFLQLTNSTNRKTSVEVQGMMMESGAQVTFVVDSFERHVLNPAMRRHSLLMADQGRMREPSDKVKKYFKDNPDGNFGIRFIGPLAKARRWMYSMGKDMEFIQGVVVPMSQVDENAKDWIDTGALFDRARQFMSGGRSVIKTKDEVDALRAERQMQQMKMAQMQARQEALKQGQAPEAGSPAEKVMAGE